MTCSIHMKTSTHRHLNLHSLNLKLNLTEIMHYLHIKYDFSYHYKRCSLKACTDMSLGEGPHNWRPPDLTPSIWDTIRAPCNGGDTTGYQFSTARAGRKNPGELVGKTLLLHACQTDMMWSCNVGKRTTHCAVLWRTTKQTKYIRALNLCFEITDLYCRVRLHRRKFPFSWWTRYVCSEITDR